MSNHDIQEKDEGIEIARRMAEEEEGIGRRPHGPAKYVVPTIMALRNMWFPPSPLYGVFFSCRLPAG
jgi:hypothetical protein